MALTQANEPLSDDRLTDLLSLAQRLSAAAHAEHLECVLADRAITHITRDERAQPLRLTSPAAVAAAAGQVVQALRISPPTVARALLDWAEPPASGSPMRNWSGTGGPASTLALPGRNWSPYSAATLPSCGGCSNVWRASRQE